MSTITQQYFYLSTLTQNMNRANNTSRLFVHRFYFSFFLFLIVFMPSLCVDELGVVQQNCLIGMDVHILMLVKVEMKARGLIELFLPSDDLALLSSIKRKE